MAGAGYNIPISVSLAESLSIPTSYSAPNIITYGSGNAIVPTTSAESSPIQPATATSSAAEGGNSAAQTQGSGVGSPVGSSAGGGISQTSSNPSFLGGNNNTLTYIAIGIAVLAVVVVIVKR